MKVLNDGGRNVWNVEEWRADLSAILLFNDFNLFVKSLFLTLQIHFSIIGRRNREKFIQRNSSIF